MRVCINIFINLEKDKILNKWAVDNRSAVSIFVNNVPIIYNSLSYNYDDVDV